MTDLFENTILCRKCEKPMEKSKLSRNGFLLRVMHCKKCNERVIHPLDEQEYNKFINLRNREFSVKMRLVGNSYAVSIPKEIVSFMNEVASHKKEMDDIVKLCFEEIGRISLNFGNFEKLNHELKIVKKIKNGN